MRYTYLVKKIIISIITVSYNAVKTIEQTISSVVNQSYPDIEYIIIDGGSTDGTVDIIKKYEDRIAYWVSEPDGGIYDAMNKGIKVATGDYIQIIGADDCLINEVVIADVVSEIKNKEADLYCYGVIGVDEVALKEKYLGNRYVRHGNPKYTMIPHPGMFVNSSLYLKFPLDNSYKIAADYKFFLQCYFDHSVVLSYFDMPVVYFSLGGVSSKSIELAEMENIKIFKELNILSSASVLFKVRWYIKILLLKLHLLSFVRKVFGVSNWNRHECENKPCRWCKRI